MFGFQASISLVFVLQQNVLYATDIEIRSMIFVQNVFHRVTAQVSVLIRSLRPHGQRIEHLLVKWESSGSVWTRCNGAIDDFGRPPKLSCRNQLLTRRMHEQVER